MCIKESIQNILNAIKKSFYTHFTLVVIINLFKEIIRIISEK